MKFKNDIALIFSEATGANIACAIQGRLKAVGYRIAMVPGTADAVEARQLILESEAALLLCTPDVPDACCGILNLAIEIKKSVVAIWPNNGRPWTWGDKDDEFGGIIPFTLDMNGTDFEVSLD